MVLKLGTYIWHLLMNEPMKFHTNNSNSFGIIAKKKKKKLEDKKNNYSNYTNNNNNNNDNDDNTHDQ